MPRARLLPLALLALVPGVAWTQGNPVGPEFRVNTYTTNNQVIPAVASDSVNFVVVWNSQGQDGSAYGVFAQRYSSSGTPLGPEFRVNTYTTGPQVRASVAADGSGNFVVVWDSLAQDGSSYGIFGQRYASSGTPLGPEFRVNTSTTDAQVYPAVASDASGNFVVVWESNLQDGSSFGVFGQRFASSGAPLGPEFRVNTYTTNVQDDESVASDSSGNFVVVWRSLLQDGSNYGVFGQRYADDGSPLGPEFRVNTNTSQNQTEPTVAVASPGSFLVVWEDAASPLDSSSWAVIGQRYASDGSPLGGEFRVNSQSAGGQRYPAITSRPGSDFVVAWQSFSQDGSTYGVYAQRFCTALTSVTIAVNGSTTVCPTGTGGLATVIDSDGGVSTHQWGFRTMSGGTITDIVGQTGTAYTLNGADFPGAGSYLLVCTTTPACGSLTTSNEVGVTVDATDATPPAVTPPASLATTQTLCM
jgi:hypothetical protein